MSNFGYEFKGEKVEAFIDSDSDGVKSLELKLSIKELVEEVLLKGGKAEKKISFEMNGLSLVAKVDSDGDGEAVFEVVANVAEAGDEILSKFKK